MVSAITPLGTNGAKKQRITLKFSCNKQNDNQESGTEEEVEQKISEQVIFTFSKELPRPTDSPFLGILRKRKLPDHPEDGIKPASKLLSHHTNAIIDDNHLIHNLIYEKSGHLNSNP
ncbi:hypothetical protein CBL_14004 [Carabus blaptoides fortunei]